MKCYLCGCHITKGRTTQDHVIPKTLWNKYGLFDYSGVHQYNVLPSCKRCNEMKDSSVLLLPLSCPSWWPIGMEQNRNQLIPPLQSLIRKLLQEDLDTESKESLKAWLDKSNHYYNAMQSFDKEPILVKLPERITAGV